MRSITACDSRNVAVAAALSPLAIAFFTFLTAVRNADFWLALRWRVASAWRARLRACAELAMKSRSSKKTGHNTRFSHRGQGAVRKQEAAALAGPDSDLNLLRTLSTVSGMTLL